MPKTAIDFSKCLIYKLVCNNLDVKEIYVGSTTNFTQRKKLHKNACNYQNNSEYNNLKYQIIRENGGWNNWCMIEIEKFPCKDNREALARERYWFETLHAEMNVKRPILTDQERKDQYKNYYENNKEKERERLKKFYENNKEKIIEKSKNWYENNKEKIKEKSKNYCNNNKEKRNEQSRNWYENNKEKRKEKCICDCGCIISIGYKSQHFKSNKHQQYIQSIN
jgi:hypothetical protein